MSNFMQPNIFLGTAYAEMYGDDEDWDREAL